MLWKQNQKEACDNVRSRMQSEKTSAAAAKVVSLLQRPAPQHSAPCSILSSPRGLSVSLPLPQHYLPSRTITSRQNYLLESHMLETEGAKGKHLFLNYIMKYRNQFLFKLTKRRCAGKSSWLLFHDRGQRGGELIPLELQFDKFHSDGELRLVHSPVIIHIS